jgi:hypothetical protein
MSTLTVANVHFESTANNRIQYSGSNNISFFLAGANTASINSTSLAVNGSLTTVNVAILAKTDNYTLASADSGSIITVSNTAAKTITVAASLPVGFRCMITQIGTGNVAISNAAGVTMNSRTGGSTITSRYGSATVLVIAANTVILDGVI